MQPTCKTSCLATSGRKETIIEQLLRTNKPAQLLSPMASNAKTAKGGDLPYLGATFNGLPSRMFQSMLRTRYGLRIDLDACPGASPACRKACLRFCGRLKFDSALESSFRKMLLYWYDRDAFEAQLCAELEKLERKARRLGLKPVVRLNCLTDLDFLRIIERYPSIQFYDYSKDIDRLRRVVRAKRLGRYLNYHLTFSASEGNLTEQLEALRINVNVAVVFRNREAVPEWWLDAPTYDGETHDFRFLDPTGDGVGNVCALVAKGKAAKQDSSGFVKDGLAVALGAVTYDNIDRHIEQALAL